MRVPNMNQIAEQSPSKGLTSFLVIYSLLVPIRQIRPAAEAAEKASIEGVVVNQVTKQAVRRAEVNLRKRSKSGDISGEPNAYTATTDASGKFRIDGIDPGDYVLLHTKHGFLNTRAYFGLSPRDLTLTPGESLTGLRYSLMPQAIITGRAVEEDGEPVQNAFVTLFRYRYDHGSYHPSPLGWPQRTDDRGEFRFVDVPPGRYYLQADARRGRTFGAGAPGTRPAAPGAPRVDFVPTYHLNATDLGQAMRIDVQAGQELSAQDVILRKEKVVRVSGKVLDADGTTVRNAVVSLEPAGSSVGGAGGMGLMVDNNGTFAANSVPPGRYLAHPIKGDESNRQSQVVPVNVGDEGLQNLVIQVQPTMVAKGALLLDGSDRNDVDCVLSAGIRGAPGGRPGVPDIHRASPRSG